MLINNEIVNRIINEVDIVDVVQEYVPLTLKSKNFWGVCPFHNDSNPSMSVNREKKIFKCFREKNIENSTLLHGKFILKDR